MTSESHSSNNFIGGNDQTRVTYRSGEHQRITRTPRSACDGPKTRTERKYTQLMCYSLL